jgi:phenylalanyl-tRNA synthetase beta chain
VLISFAWLRALVPITAESEEVSRRLTARGLTVDAVTVLSDDTVFDLDVPANRPDALGHLGVAREVAAAFGVPLANRAPAVASAGKRVNELVSVTVADPTLCGRYTASVVRGVRVGPSPTWVASRLAACGLRSINNVVDASNLVLLELGQPVHFFDLARIQGRAIHVRAAAAGERLETLDGITRELAPGMIVIADAGGPVALGGVMGGAGSQITADTRDVLVEAAWFSPAAVRATARALGLSTDASQRFERGCDPEAPSAAQELSARLLTGLAGGTPAPGLIDVRPSQASPRRLTVRLARASRLLGYAVSHEEAMSALGAVGLAPNPLADAIEVTVPSWRVDLLREADLVEEIGRHLGYDRIPSRPPALAARAPSSGAGANIEERVRDRFAALGFNEAVNYAMIGPGEDDAFVPDGTPAPMALDNPIAETLGSLRRSLLPGLLRAADQNLRHGADAIRLFEIGGVFLARGPQQLPAEPARAAFAWSGPAESPHWSQKARAVDPWDAAGLIEDLLGPAADVALLRRTRAELPALHPGQSFAWHDDAGRAVAWCGRLHPGLASRLGMSAPLWLGETDLSLVEALGAPGPAYRPIPRFPGAWRDLSIVLDAGASAGSVLRALASIVSPAPATMAWIDRYAGPPLLPGQSAMTLRVMLHPSDRTLTDAEAESYRLQLVAALDSVPGVRLRRMDT